MDREKLMGNDNACGNFNCFAYCFSLEYNMIRFKPTTERQKDIIEIMRGLLGIMLLPYILPLWSMFLQFSLNIDKFFGL